MSQDAKHQNVDQSSINTILRSLTNRPNIQSTLILSRKDGSIIRATGFPQADSSSNIPNGIRERTQTNAMTTAPSQNFTETSKDSNNAEVQKELLSPVQYLASTIHEFVKISSKLAAGVSQPGAYQQASPGNIVHGTTTQSQEQRDQLTITKDEDVQLLRLRTKKQEIIIFPDPNYLCCVVQNLAKTTGRGEST